MRTWAILAMTCLMSLVAGNAAFAASPAAGCFSEHDTYKISGTLRVKVMRGVNDQMVKPYVLDLDQPACFVFDDPESNRPQPPVANINAIQIAFTGSAYKDFVAANLNRRISLYGQFFQAMTAHHHLPVLIAVNESITLPSGSAASNGADALDAASVVRAFYEALGRGDGQVASGFVVPEKRSSGPYAADNLSRFYGGFSDPLAVTGLSVIDENLVQVTYHWASGRKRCDGAATVTVTRRNGESLIQSIKSNC